MVLGHSHKIGLPRFSSVPVSSLSAASSEKRRKGLRVIAANYTSRFHE
jgi:hypothetical protein